VHFGAKTGNRKWVVESWNKVGSGENEVDNN